MFTISYGTGSIGYWIPNFPSLMPACVPFLGRYRTTPYASTGGMYSNIDDAWPYLQNTVTLPNALTFLNTSGLSMSASASASFDWNYVGSYSGDVANGTLDFSASATFTTGYAGQSLSGKYFPTIVSFDTTESEGDGGGGVNYNLWQLWANLGSVGFGTGNTISEIGFELARNANGTELRMGIQGIIQMDMGYDVFGTVTNAVWGYDDSGDYGIITPTQFNMYSLPYGVPQTGEYDIGFGTIDATIVIADTYGNLEGGAVQSGLVTIAGASFAWAGYISNHLEGDGTAYPITWSGDGGSSASASISFS